MGGEGFSLKVMGLAWRWNRHGFRHIGLKRLCFQCSCLRPYIHVNLKKYGRDIYTLPLHPPIPPNTRTYQYSHIEYIYAIYSNYSRFLLLINFFLCAVAIVDNKVYPNTVCCLLPFFNSNHTGQLYYTTIKKIRILSIQGS